MELHPKVVKALEQFKLLYPELEQLNAEYEAAREVEQAANDKWKALHEIVMSGTPLTPKQLAEYRETHDIVYGDSTYPKFSLRYDMRERVQKAHHAIYQAFNETHLDGYLDKYGMLKAR